MEQNFPKTLSFDKKVFDFLVDHNIWQRMSAIPKYFQKCVAFDKYGKYTCSTHNDHFCAKPFRRSFFKFSSSDWTPNAFLLFCRKRCQISSWPRPLATNVLARARFFSEIFRCLQSRKKALFKAILWFWPKIS